MRRSPWLTAETEQRGLGCLHPLLLTYLGQGFLEKQRRAPASYSPKLPKSRFSNCALQGPQRAMGQWVTEGQSGQETGPSVRPLVSQTCSGL